MLAEAAKGLAALAGELAGAGPTFSKCLLTLLTRVSKCLLSLLRRLSKCLLRLLSPWQPYQALARVAKQS